MVGNPLPQPALVKSNLRLKNSFSPARGHRFKSCTAHHTPSLHLCPHLSLIRAVEPLDLLVLVAAVVVVVDGCEGRVDPGDVVPRPGRRDALGAPVA